MKNIFVLIVLVITFNVNLNAQPGSLDLTFNPADIGYKNGDGVGGFINSSLLQNNGRIILGGNFNSYNGKACGNIIRLNADGKEDTTFETGTGFDDRVFTTIVQPDGKIIVGGWFTSFNGTSIRGLARLNVNGSLDTTFYTGTGPGGSYPPVYSSAIQSDGKILIGGDFNNYNGTTVYRIARLHQNGALDTSFLVGAGMNNGVKAIVVQPDGKILIAGYFSAYNATVLNGIARLNTDGSLDSFFDPGDGADAGIESMAIQANGKIIIGGYFNTYDGISIQRLACLNSDGSPDSSFTGGTGPSHGITSIALQSDNKIIIGGLFTSYNGNTVNSIARLDTNGVLDFSFHAGTGTDGEIHTAVIQPDGKILIGGHFNLYNRILHRGATRLETNGDPDSTFNSVTGFDGAVSAIAMQSDNKIIVGGYFTENNNRERLGLTRLESDGSTDLSFNPGLGLDGGGNIYALAYQPDGKIIFAGNFISFNGSPRNYIGRLHSNGSLDTTFNPEYSANGIIYSVSLQNDGKIIIGGDFYSFSGSPNNHIARLNTNGTLDTTFHIGSGINGPVYSCLIQPDGKIIIGGNFWNYNGTFIKGIVRIHPDGIVDSSFISGSGATGSVRSISVQSDSKVILAGDISDYNGTLTENILRLNSNGSLDTTFDPQNGPNSTVYSSTILPSGKIIISGAFTQFNGTNTGTIARLLSDGSLDSTFITGSSADGIIFANAIQSNGKLLIGGSFTSYNGIGRNRIARLDNDTTINIGEIFDEFHSIATLYPNPATSSFKIITELQNNNLQIELYNFLGNKVLGRSIDSHDNSIDIGSITKGIYIVKINFNNSLRERSILEKLIIQ